MDFYKIEPINSRHEKNSIIAISVVNKCQKEVLAMKSDEQESQENKNPR